LAYERRDSHVNRLARLLVLEYSRVGAVSYWLIHKLCDATDFAAAFRLLHTSTGRASHMMNDYRGLTTPQTRPVLDKETTEARQSRLSCLIFDPGYVVVLVMRYPSSERAYSRIEQSWAAGERNAMQGLGSKREGKHCRVVDLSTTSHSLVSISSVRH
jgi:hypothetical protein